MIKMEREEKENQIKIITFLVMASLFAEIRNKPAEKELSVQKPSVLRREG